MPSKLEIMRANGFSDDEVHNFKVKTFATMQAGGFSNKEIGDFLGVSEFNDDSLQAEIDALVSSMRTPETEGAEVNLTVSEAIQAGFQNSATGMFLRDKPPDIDLPENMPIEDRLVSGLAGLIPDIPLMAAGALLGIEGGPPTMVGGAFALPAGLRKVMMDSFEDGSIDTAGEFGSRLGGALEATVKGEITGVATSLAGTAGKALATKGAIKTGLAEASPKAATAVAESLDFVGSVGAMVSVGAGLEGQLPEPHHFLDASIMIGGLKASPRVVRTLRKVYEKTGKQPLEVARDAEFNPSILEDILAEEVPRVYAEIERNVQELDVTAKKKLPIVEELNSRDASKVDVETVDVSSKLLDDVDTGAPIRAAISRGGKEPKPVKFLTTWQGFYTDYLDRFHPSKVLMDKIRKATGINVGILSDVYKLQRTNAGTVGIIQRFLKEETLDFKTHQPNGVSLESIYEQIGKKEMVDFGDYAVAKRGLELLRRGEPAAPKIELPDGLTRENMQRHVDKFDPKFKKIHKELLDYQDRVLQYLVDSGVLSDSAVKAIREANQDYVPFYRYFIDKAHKEGGSQNVFNPLRKIKGGKEGEIIDPLESIIKNTHVLIQVAENNAIRTALLDQLGTGFVTIAKKKVRPITVSAKEMKRAIKDAEEEHGLNIPVEEFAIFRPLVEKVADNQVVVFRKGAPVILEVPKEVAATFLRSDRDTLGMFAKIAAVPAKTLRAGAVLAPEFTERNVIRDSFNAFIFSEGGFRPIIDTFRGLGDHVGNTKWAKSYMSSGSMNNSLLSLERKYIRDDMQRLLHTNGAVRNLVSSPLAMLHILTDAAEKSGRLGVFRRNLESKGLTPETATKAQLKEAGFDSREATLDFARMGANVRAYNAITAFFNANLQGIDRVARGFKDNPVRTTNRVIAGITVPSVMLHLTHYDWEVDDGPKLADWYTAIPQWERDTYWVFRTGDGEDSTILRVPKPFEIGLFFGTGAELALDSLILDDPTGPKELLESLGKAAIPNFVPTLVAAPIELWANRSILTGGPIIPAALEGQLPQYQYTPYTSELTKFVGQQIDKIPGFHDSQAASPMAIDAVIRSYTGGLGRHTVNFADLILRKAGVIPDPPRSQDTLADMPIVKAFVVRNPSMSAAPVTEFYERYGDSKRVVATINRLLAEGDIERAVFELSTRTNVLSNLDDVSSTLGELGALARMIEVYPEDADLFDSPETAPIEKRQIIDKLYRMRIEIARIANELMDAQEEALAEVNK